MRNRASKAFTLVEILIVVVILGILAAIVIPQFTNASQDAQIGNVETQLQTIRSQIELYRVRNNGQYPNLGGFSNENGWGDDTENGMIQGNYLRSVPINPRTGTSTIALGADPAAPVATGDDGWWFDATTGDFGANGFDEVNRVWLE
jgi:general secretion pathway protein G